MGRSTAGKTTLCQRLANEALVYEKTQTITLLNDKFIDTPGEYLERNSMIGALIVTATEADELLLVQDPLEHGTMFPPGFQSFFGKEATGIITKCDVANVDEIEEATQALLSAGVERIFCVSSVTGLGITTLYEYLYRKDQTQQPILQVKKGGEL